MISSDRRPLIPIQAVCRGRVVVEASPMAQHRLLPTHLSNSRPQPQENRHFITHYDFAKGVLETLASLRLEINKWYDDFYNSGSMTACSITESDVRNRLSSIYSDLEKLVKTVDSRRPDSVALRALSTIYDEAAGLPAGCNVDEEGYRDYIERAAALQDFSQGYFESEQRQEIVRTLRNMPNLDPERLRAISVEKAHAMFKKVLRTFKDNERRLIMAHKWRISLVVDISFLETIIEVEFGRHRDKLFVPQLKAALFVRQGELVSVSLGSPRETLWSRDTDVSSRHEVYQKMTIYASNRLFSTYSHAKLHSYQAIAMVLNFLQIYTLSFSLPCCGCNKVMRDYLPPMLLSDISQNRPTFFHENCRA